MALGCAGGDGPPDRPDADAPGDDDDDDDVSPPAEVDFVAGPIVRENEGAGLTAWLDVVLDGEAALEIDVTGPDRTFTVASGTATAHRVLLLGLHADTPHDLVVRAVDRVGVTLAERAGTYRPPPLPEAFPPFSVGAVDLERMEPGVTLASFGPWLVAVDPEGHAVWYVLLPGSVHEATRLANGNLLVLVNRTTVTELDLAGAVVAQWRAARTTDEPAGSVAVDVDALHHDVIELPDGGFVSLSIERRWIEGYPSSEVDASAPPAPAWVAGDVVVEYARDGAVRGSWPLLDRLDPLRVAYDAVNGNYWEDFGPWRGEEVKDWSHGNAVSYDPATDTLLAGLRHQDAVVAVSRATGEAQWVIAPRANWSAETLPLVLTPEDPGAVPYHPHGAKFTPSGTVMLFDNGNNRASAFEPKLDPTLNFSRALELAIDPVAMTYREVWSFGEELLPPHFSGSLGDADPLPATDNVLITFGNVADPKLGGVRILEVTRGHDIVWDLVVPLPDATSYRAQRIGGMIPGL